MDGGPAGNFRYFVLVGVQHFSAEGHEAQGGHFKQLDAERDADDGDAEACADDGIENRSPKTCANDPNDVRDQRGCPAAVGDVLSKGRKRQLREFEALPSERDADDGDVEDDADDDPKNGRDKPAADDPDDVADGTHAAPFVAGFR